MSGLSKWLVAIVTIAALLWFVASQMPSGDKRNRRVDISNFKADRANPAVLGAQLETATLAAGCYWCVEAVLERIKGVASVESGFMGGESENPTYGEVSSGRTGHAECVQVRFDPSVLSYADLLTIFWELHDPTTKNRQGADRGAHYRSVIFYHSQEQRVSAEKSLREKDASGDLKDKIVTEVVAAGRFTAADSYHQNYFSSNPSQSYCLQVISPKLKKLGLE